MKYLFILIAFISCAQVQAQTKGDTLKDNPWISYSLATNVSKNTLVVSKKSKEVMIVRNDTTYVIYDTLAAIYILVRQFLADRPVREKLWEKYDAALEVLRYVPANGNGVLLKNKKKFDKAVRKCIKLHG